MPKIVDPAERRRAVVEAVYRVVRRDGIERASLRNIAAEAGLAIGSVRHYFTSHDELMVFAMNEMVEDATTHILRHADGLQQPAPSVDEVSVRERAARIEAVLAEFLPLDERRVDMTVVWLEFVIAARTRPELRQHANKLHDGIRTIVGRVLRRIEGAGRLRKDVDVPLETIRLCSLIDGLALAVVLRPGTTSPETASRVLRRHMADITTGGLFTEPGNQAAPPRD